ncbi:cytochrome c/c1 heme-lyase [Nemania sp. FL0916]|nr:cytochrome c/c1 heme-lyase [Nemania sp. FL0916]
MLHDIIDQIFLVYRTPDNNPSRLRPATATASAMPPDSNQPAACPVDHKSREAWLEKAKAQTQTTESCPVDHGAREVWTQHARAAAASMESRPTQTSTPTTTSSSWSSYLPRIPFLSSTEPTPTSPSPPAHGTQNSSNAPHLGLDREVSTIPRTTTTTPSPIGSSDHTVPSPANNEQETGADKTTGNWIYPSERMFFDAMKRKGHDPRAADMRTVVPIHNAVNERAWLEIKAWEAPYIEGNTCSGPRLHSFSGLSTKLSPKARLNTFLGYQAPFDRHDWVVDRCGREIEYVIDFYAGRNPNPANTTNPAGGSVVGADGKLSFYLDVRPKMNSWEGVKMRAFRAVGLT